MNNINILLKSLKYQKNAPYSLKKREGKEKD
jgi:hypothetical protein